ncbi:MAG TPA: hypothetical protein PKK69_06355 [Ferruginibacter sp.]|nr:hypothetical protein [Ferruginibacter sp.]
MKQVYVLLLLLMATQVQAQRIEHMEANLYTDSLKKGTYNYINIDGKLSNGRYLPLDTTQLTFQASSGIFYGNNLFLPADSPVDSVHITVRLKGTDQQKDFTLYTKKAPDPKLPSESEMLDQLERNSRQKKKKG